MNAKSEFIDFVRYSSSPVLCAIITHVSSSAEIKSFLLNKDYKSDDYTKFLDALDFVYENDGMGELDGNIWFEDGSWAERFIDYNCTDLWICKSYPSIPEVLSKTRANKIIDLLDSSCENN